MMGQVIGVLLGFSLALVITVVAEAAIAWLLGLRTWRMQIMLVLINVITNLCLNLLINTFAFFGIHAIASPFDLLLVSLELMVIFAEAQLFRLLLKLPGKKAFILSVLANTASFLAGVFILWS